MSFPLRSSSSGSELPAAAAHAHAHAAPSEPKSNGEVVTVDAGLKSLDHYKRALPKWRYNLRRRLLPLIRWETPYLAYLQNKTRTPALDSYFAVTANLGTHTFFMIGLPVIIWFGFVGFGLGLVRILAAGVFFTGFTKDLLSLPRPLSPPLHRITMSGSVALEYGFPSTHSTNAVSVAVYGVLMLREAAAAAAVQPRTQLLLEALSYSYAVSIVIGRLYCGMHGFLDVVVGSLLGAAIGLLEFHYGAALDEGVAGSAGLAPLIVTLAIIALVRVHPEPADDCPCFDDSVAFAGVVVGVEVGTWHFRRYSSYSYYFADAAAGVAGWPVVAARVALGVVLILAWREVMKPTLLKALPHLFRVIETHGLNLPRRFFVQASQYDDIPEVLRLRTDNVIPGVSDFPNIVRTLKKARRGRSVSIGPQSAADAYETLAYRERRRRESIGSQASLKSKGSLYDLREQQQQQAEGMANGGSGGVGGSGGDSSNDIEGKAWSTASGIQKGPLARYEEMMGQGIVVESPVVATTMTTTMTTTAATADDDMAPHARETDEPELYIGREDELGEKEMFEKLVKPRVRYDVEVVTKLIVYAGIGWIAVEFAPIVFEVIGLGR